MKEIIDISIVIATYNAEQYIERALNSVKLLNFDSWECIIQDGGSTDSTLSIIKKFTIKDNRFKLFEESDKGVFDAFNRGWKRANGKWIYFLGSDDELTANGLRHLLAATKDKKFDIVYGTTYTRYRSGKIKLHEPGYWNKSMPFSMPCSHQAIIMTKRSIEKLGGFNLNFHILADFEMMNHAYYNHYSILRVPIPIAIFQLGGLSTDNLHSLTERYRIHIKYGVSKPRAFIHRVVMTLRFLLYKFKHRWID